MTERRTVGLCARGVGSGGGGSVWTTGLEGDSEESVSGERVAL